MALADVKTRIQSQMQAVTGIGKVYTRLRNLAAEKDKDALLVSEGTLNVWMIDRESSVLNDRSVNQNFTEQRDTLVVTGYLAVQDANASSDVFDQLIDSIIQAINADRRPPSLLAGTVSTATPPMLRRKDLHMYVGVLCHHAEISMVVTWRYLQ